MKVLLDPSLTANPAKCSTSIQFWEFVNRTLNVEKRKDVFFYWVVPDRVEEEDMAFYPKHPNVHYIRMPRSKDRVRDYITLTEPFTDVLAFNGPFWDFDVLMTVRTALVPLMSITMNSPRTKKWSWLKEIWVIEDMPMMDFKETVITMVPDVHDRLTLEGLLAADRAYVCSYHEKPAIMRAARNYFTPSLVRGLDRKLENIITSQFSAYHTKPKNKRYVTGGEMPFGLAYIGRMEKANNIVDINDIMTKTWITRGDKVKLIVCTVSDVVPVFDKDIVDVRTPPREEFWKIVKNEVHAFIYMPNGGGFSLSLIEPLMLGTPVITTRTEAHESLLGKSYPFFADGPAQVPGLVKAMYDNYEYCYEQFRDWMKNWFKPTYTTRMEADLLFPKLSRNLDAYEQKLRDRVGELQSLKENRIVAGCAALLGTSPQGKEIRTVFDGIQHMADTGELDQLDVKIKPDFRLKGAIAFSPAWHPIKVGLKMFYGFVDGSVEVGHMVKGSDQ